MQNQNVTNIEHDLSQFGQELKADVLKVEKSVLNPVEKALRLRPTELFLHLAMLSLFAYILYLLLVNSKERTVTNLLLLLIAVALLVQVQQSVSIKAQLNL